jgi:polyisoprenoid-binding protein YceI
MKDDKLKSKDFFDVKDDPYITFHSDKVVEVHDSRRLKRRDAGVHRDR